jgi:uncharacterized LabA/DUF88 family protein
MNPFAFKDQRVGVFLDTQNIYHSAKNFYQRKVDFWKLINILVGERNLIYIFAYVIKTGLSPKEIDFFESLSKNGIKVKIKEAVVYPDGSIKADIDVNLVIDVIRFSSNLDVIILVSGDSDFVPLVEYLKNNGKQVEVAGFGKNTSVKLKEVCDYFYDLDDLRKYILIK